jgi:tRNA threonylcarbamoyl adenosine modification protein (Sua5/YciO/YrdC/YwlC family)
MKRIYIDPVRIDQALVKKVAQSILKGNIIAVPTETVYGLAGRSDRPEVAKKLYALKRRPPDKQFSFACASVERVINNYFDIMPPFAYRLMEKFLPGPLTIIYYTPEDKKIGIRVPSHAVTRAVLQEVGIPVYLPSANISGEKEATSASEVEVVFGPDIDYIVEGGTCVYTKPSTVLDITQKPFKVLRPGVVSEQDVTKVFIKKRVLFVCTGNSCRSPMAQFLLRKYLQQQMLLSEDRYEVFSAGTAAFDGSVAAPHVVSILKETEEVDARGFRAKKLDKYMLLASDLIFTMEDRQSDYVRQLVPSTEGRIFNLKKFLPPELEKDIPDPIGKEFGVYEEVYTLIKKAVLELINWL